MADDEHDHRAYRWTMKRSEDGTRIVFDQKVYLSQAEAEGREAEDTAAEEYLERKEIEANIRELVRANLTKAMYCQSGAVLLGGIRTLKPGAWYIIGLNPAGDPKTITRPIIDSIAQPGELSCYTHECWQPKCKDEWPCLHAEGGRTQERYLRPHQRRMIALTREALGLEPAQIFATNAIFARSARISQLKSETTYSLVDWWRHCWPVHQHFLSVVRPKTIISLGHGGNSSAFGLLHAEAGHPPWRKIGDDNRRGGWIYNASLRLAPNDVLETSVIGIPHPSYHALGPILMHQLWEVANLPTAV